MLEPVSQEWLLPAAIAGGSIVLAGAGYALLFSLSKVFNRPGLMPLAYAFYLILMASVCLLAFSLSLSGYWWLLVATMLVGYLIAPHGIWHLCVATHAIADQGEANER